jgi:hypothetical protein
MSCLNIYRIYSRTRPQGYRDHVGQAVVIAASEAEARIALAESCSDKDYEFLDDGIYACVELGAAYNTVVPGVVTADYDGETISFEYIPLN